MEIVSLRSIFECLRASPATTHETGFLPRGKVLFSKSGYEQTSTAAIAREAGTSESQLVRYFGGKSGLLETFFNEAWGVLNDAIHVLASAMLGCAEGMIRDCMIAERTRQRNPFDDDAIRRVFTSMVNGLTPTKS
jgi:AcrR family transcriptional regulator